MEDGVYQLSSTLLKSLLFKEQNVKCITILPLIQENVERVTSEDRDQQAKWICTMGNRLGLGLNTVGIAITIFDRVLGVVSVRTKYVNCVAMASLYLAVKLHEELFISSSSVATKNVLVSSSMLSLNSDLNSDVEDCDADEQVVSYVNASSFLSKLNVNYTFRELNRMESEILRILNWDLLSLPSCAQFIEAMLTVIDLPHLVDSSALRKNFEAVVTHWELCGQFRSSTLALSLLSLMIEWTLTYEWERCVTQSLKNIFKIDDSQFTKCRLLMIEVLQRFHREQIDGPLNIPTIDTKTNSLQVENLVSRFQKKCRRRERKRFTSLGEEALTEGEEEGDQDVIMSVLYGIVHAAEEEKS